MLFFDITYIDPNQQAIPHAYIGIQGRWIDYVGQTPPLDPTSYGRVILGKDLLLTAGFYNTHTHAAMALLRGYGENMKLQDWLTQRIFPFEARLTPEDVYWATQLCALEMLRFGVVSATDMYMKGDAMARGFLDSGLKANFSVGTTCMDSRSYKELPQYQELLSLKEKYHGYDDGRLRTDLSLHAEYTTTERVVRGAAEAAQELGLRVHIHVSETALEVVECQERRKGRTPVQYLHDCGLLASPTTAAHCVHLTEEDIALLAADRVTVATCPKSNLKLASGICPGPQLLQAGVNVALATDSVASNNNLDFLEEMRFFALLSKGIQGDPTLISPAQAFYCATQAGARAQGREDCGVIAPGYRADLAVFSTRQPHWQPTHDLLHNLVYSGCGSDVVMTLVDGTILYDHGDFPQADPEKIYREVTRSCQRILSEL